MGGAEIAAIIGVIGNLILGFWGLRKKQKLDKVSEGVVIIERAVEENKVLIDDVVGVAAGNVIAKRIKEYGPVAREAVSLARKIANAIKTK